MYLVHDVAIEYDDDAAAAAVLILVVEEEEMAFWVALISAAAPAAAVTFSSSLSSSSAESDVGRHVSPFPVDAHHVADESFLDAQCQHVERDPLKSCMP